MQGDLPESNWISAVISDLHHRHLQVLDHLADLRGDAPLLLQPELLPFGRLRMICRPPELPLHLLDELRDELLGETPKSEAELPRQELCDLTF